MNQVSRKRSLLIGKAISLKGFQLHEVEPLQRGLEGKFSKPQAVMQEILEWTGGQPFLTQKLCQFMVEESEKENSRSVEQVVKSCIIENWESQDEPEHLRTIQARILRDEQRAGYLLELYQQIRLREEQSEITADDTLEQSELQLSGLVVRQQNKLRVYNPIYQEVFDQNWVENQLRNLRPYSENFRFWVASGGTDKSRLLRAKALQEAELWARDKSLSYQDRQFLAASKEKEIQEEIAAREQEAALEREKKDREAAESRNQLLSEANKKAQQQIRKGTTVFFLTFFIALLLGLLSAIQGNKALEAQKQAKDAQQSEQKAKKSAEQAKEQEQKAKDNENLAQQRIKKAKKTADQAKEQEKIAKDNEKKAQESASTLKQDAQTAKQKLATVQRDLKEKIREISRATKQLASAQNKETQIQGKLQYKERELEKINIKNKEIRTAVETVQKLSKLAGDLRNENLTSQSNKALRLAGLSFNVKDYNLKQALLLASISQAYQHLKKWNEAEQEIKKSNDFLSQTDQNNITSSEGLQVQFLTQKAQGTFLAEKKETNQAIESYK